MDRVFNPPNTLNSLSQAAAAVCGMRGAGWELLDSWILEACGLISRTKPTQWGGADVAFFPPSTGIFYQRGKRWLKVCTDLLRLLKSLQTMFGDSSVFVFFFRRLCFCTISVVLATWKEFPPLISFLMVVRLQNLYVFWCKVSKQFGPWNAWWENICSPRA